MSPFVVPAHADSFIPPAESCERDIFGASGFGEPIATLGLVADDDFHEYAAWSADPEPAPSSCRVVMTENADGTFSAVQVFGVTTLAVSGVLRGGASDDVNERDADAAFLRGLAGLMTGPGVH